MRGDSQREERGWLEKLMDVDLKRSGSQDLAAEGLITLDELRAKLVVLEETRETAHRDLAALSERRKRIETLERDANTLLESYAVMTPESLGALVAEERHRIYRMLRLRIQAQPDKFWRHKVCSERRPRFVAMKQGTALCYKQDQDAINNL